MIRSGVVLLAAVVCLAPAAPAETPAGLSGTCRIAPATSPGQVRVKLVHDPCRDAERCGSSDTELPVGAFRRLSLADLSREGISLTAELVAEAGTLSCSGTVHNSVLGGDYAFRPDPRFVDRMRQMGFSGELDSDKLEAYTLFGITTAWIRSLQEAGVRGLTVDNLIALQIFKADPAYVRDLSQLGYKDLDADKLIALRVHHVTPEEVRQVRALGYQPSLDELVQMRIFQITPEFIKRMQGRGLKDLSISKLVQIRIFHLEE